MYSSASPRDAAPIEPDPSSARVVAALFTSDLDEDALGVAIPHSEIHLVARFGPAFVSGGDVHAMGGRDRVQRKLLRGGQRTFSIRLRLGTTESLLGASASEIAGGIVPLEDLWGDAEARRVRAALADARDTVAAARILEQTVAERARSSGARGASGHTELTLAAADRLVRANVAEVADSLGVSERHLRRVFRDVTGVGPKTFAKLARFRHAVRDARAEPHPNWARIAATTGYYDQAHLIAEFRTISGVTPQALMAELRGAGAVHGAALRPFRTRSVGPDRQSGSTPSAP